jgi:anti-sigma regulatory factor (Ser/Thr protein kinase)
MASPTETPDLPSQVVAERTHLSLPSFPHWIEATAFYLRQKAVLSGACQESRSGKLMIALHEALSNAVVHGNLELASDLKERGDNVFAEALAQRIGDPHYTERVVEVLVDCNLEQCRWIITDQGAGFNVEATLQKKQSDDPEELLASGRGILIMRSFLDEIAYEMGGRRLVLTLRRESGREKRRSSRVPVTQPLHVAPMRSDGTVDWDAAYDALSKNFSDSGVSLFQEKLAETNRILLGISINNQLHYVPAEVRHCRSLGGDMVELGCSFQHKADEPPDSVPDLSEETTHVHEAVNVLLAQHQSPFPKVDDRRRDQRVAYNERIEVLSGASAEPVIGFARDLSRSGVAFIATVPLSLEVTVIFLPHGAEPPLRLRSQVVRCTKIMDGFYDIGARFLELEGKR